MRKIKPELVSPAGDWPSLRAAVENGADSVYFGIKGLNMRHQAANFDLYEIKKVMAFLRVQKRKGYLALNVIVMNQELGKVEKALQEAKRAKVDAVILWDKAVFSLAKKLKLRIHLSTQESVSNTESVRFYAHLGVKRIVLARECTLADIQQIVRELKKEKIHCQIEAFIHGAMCVSISGRCFLSQDAFGRSANKGDCLQPCRREFTIKDMDRESEYILGQDYLLSPKDLCTIDFLDELIDSGIDAFKIEGRMRSPEYVGVTTSVYRQALDAFNQGQFTSQLKKKLKEELRSVYNRGFSNGFYFGEPKKVLARNLEHTHEKVFLGEVRKFYKKIFVADIMIRNASLKRGDQILFIGKNTPAYQTTADELQDNHRSIEEALKGSPVGVKLPFVVRPKDKVFLWKKKQGISSR
ncbi:MAG: peptidase U32 family protein [Candidatus Omnitrophota bacterium]